MKATQSKKDALKKKIKAKYRKRIAMQAAVSQMLMLQASGQALQPTDSYLTFNNQTK